MHYPDVPNLGFWRTDFKTGQTSWSTGMFIIYGLKPEIHSPSVDVLMKYLHRDDRDVVSETIHQATKSLTPFSFFYRIVRKDRSVRRLYSIGRFEIEQDGRATCRYGVCLDLTGLSKGELNGAMTRMAGIELPPLPLLLTLDSTDKNMALLLELASMADVKMRDIIVRANSGSAST